MPYRKLLPLALLPKQAKGHEIVSIMFAFKDNLTMVLSHRKHSKDVLLLSSLHQNANIKESGKPEILKFNNKTKAAVDKSDQKMRYSSAYRKTYRCPLAVLYNIFDISAYNAYFYRRCNLQLLVKMVLLVIVSNCFVHLEKN